MLIAWLCAGAGSAAPPPDLTISLSKHVVVYGDPIVLSGNVSLALSSKIVTILAQSEGQEQRELGTVGPGITGWQFVVRPRIRTSFLSQIETIVSGTVTVEVRPRVTLSMRRGIFVAKVTAGKSFEGRSILLQRLSPKHLWVGVRKAVLRRNPLEFRLKLRPGRSKIRAFVPRSVAEPGYLDGFSKTLVVTRGAKAKS
ncbi:MAG: hypothetical protein H0V25_07020 [Solirubrobacterales bacterium]|nr:hypothetical protein [Solirubrobacterales bacterium]